MDGSQPPPGGSGGKQPGSRSPPRSRKRKRGDAAPSVAGPSTPRTATRSSMRIAAAAADVLSWVRREAEGALWRAPLRRRAADQEPAREAILRVRRERAILAPDDPSSPYMKPKPGTASPKKPSLAGPVTRRRRSLALEAANTLSWLRSAAAGTLWTTLDRDLADEERMRQRILDIRRATQVPLDDLASRYLEKKSQRINTPGTRSSGRIAHQMPHSSSYLVLSPRKQIERDPIEYQADVPEWKNAPSEEDIAHYKADGETSQKLGEAICPLNMDELSTYQLPKTRKAKADKCNCKHPGSEECVRVHVNKAKYLLKNQLGKKAFSGCGLDTMGEESLRLWTKNDRKKFADIEKLIPQNEHSTFMKIALEQFTSKKPKDLANYYYNVFLPRRLATLTRADTTNAKDLGTDDDSNEDHSEKKGKSSRSSKRSRK